MSNAIERVICERERNTEFTEPCEQSISLNGIQENGKVGRIFEADKADSCKA